MAFSRSVAAQATTSTASIADRRLTILPAVEIRRGIQPP
jgi:hypothetical protein